MTVDYLSLISKYTAGEDPQTVPLLIVHSALVTKKALEIAHAHKRAYSDVQIDFRLLEEMGMLHDIGIFATQDKHLKTTGQGDYMTHITHGHKILQEEGLPAHARGALTHVGLSVEQITERNLPLPQIDHTPQTVEEEILCLADFYYSKRVDSVFHERTPQEICELLEPFGEKAVLVYTQLAEKYL